MKVRRAIDPIPSLIAWVRIRIREVPWNTGAVEVIIIPVRPISGIIEVL
jgi:hypothetical protein